MQNRITKLMTGHLFKIFPGLFPYHHRTPDVLSMMSYSKYLLINIGRGWVRCNPIEKQLLLALMFYKRLDLPFVVWAGLHCLNSLHSLLSYSALDWSPPLVLSLYLATLVSHPLLWFPTTNLPVFYASDSKSCFWWSELHSEGKK